LADFGLNIFIGKVDPRFDSSKELEDSFAFGEKLFAQFTRECSMGGLEGSFGACVKDIENGFSTGQVDSSVKKSSLGKFARTSGSGA
jgi:hypothetical protein